MFILTYSSFLLFLCFSFFFVEGDAALAEDEAAVAGLAAPVQDINPHSDMDSDDDEAHANAETMEYADHHHHAASKIQAHYRGFSTRRQVQRQHTAATTIQKNYRGYRARKAAAGAGKC